MVGHREKETKKSAVAESAVRGDRNNVMDRVGSGRIGSDRREGVRVRRIVYQPGVLKSTFLLV